MNDHITPQTPSADHTADLSDFEAMRAHFQAQGQAALLERLVDVALQSLPGVLSELERARALGDTVALAKVAHEIKGTALNLRAPQLAELGAATQDAARQSLPLKDANAASLSAALHGFVEAMRGHRLGPHA